MEVSLYIYMCVCVSYMSMPVAVQVDHRGAYWHTYICFYVMMKTALKIFSSQKAARIVGKR